MRGGVRVGRVCQRLTQGFWAKLAMMFGDIVNVLLPLEGLCTDKKVDISLAMAQKKPGIIT